MVEACNASGCTLSVQLLIEDSLVEAIGYFKASNTEPSSNFGEAVSLSADGNTLAVGVGGTGENSINNPENPYGQSSGAIYVFVRNNGKWQQQAYLKASNPDTTYTYGGDKFAHELQLSADGNTLAVGARREQSAATGINGDQSDNSAYEAGAVYVFVRVGEHWQQQAYIKGHNTSENHGFGGNLSLNADGNILAVGATRQGSAETGDINSGAVYVFERSNGIWQQQSYLKGDIKPRGGRFGRSVGLSADGKTLVVGVFDPSVATPASHSVRGPHYDDYYGAAYVFVRTVESSWQRQAYLTAPEGYWNSFGRDISLTEDGDTLAVSAQNSVHVFERVNDNWQDRAFLQASNAESGDRFGISISLSSDGSTLAVGAFEEDSAAIGLQGYQGDEFPSENSGAAYVFTKSSGNWQQQAYVKASNSQPWMFFGDSVSLSANGDTLAIGAVSERVAAAGINGAQAGDPEKTTGAVYLY